MTTLSLVGWSLLALGLGCALIELIARVRTWRENKRNAAEQRPKTFPSVLPPARVDLVERIRKQEEKR
jgi:hypothetical protein